MREQEAGFGVGQQLSTETGTRKIGIDARTELTQRWAARGEAFQQTNLQTGADRELVSAEARRETDDATASVGVRRVVDDLPQSGVQRSELMSLGGSLDVLRDRVTLRALTEQSLGIPAASLDFPERTTLGLDYHLSGATTLFTEVEDAEGELIDSTMTRVGVRSTPWSGSQLSSSVNREFSEYGPRVFATTGLTQSFKVGAAWAMDVGVDRSDTLTAPRGALQSECAARVRLHRGGLPRDLRRRTVPRRPLDDHVARRAARRRLGRALVVHGRLLPRARRGRALSVTTRWLDNATALGAGRIVDAQVSYAYRPRDSRLIVLERLDLTQDERVEPLCELRDDAFRRQRQFSLAVRQPLRARHASRRTLREEHDRRRPVRGLVDAARFGSAPRSDADARHRRAWHLARLRGRRHDEHSAGFDVGLTAARNLWISVGYNFEGFRDEHFDASRYTADGPYVRFRFKADQDTFRDLDLSRLRPTPAALAPAQRDAAVDSAQNHAGRHGGYARMPAIKWWLRIVGALYLLEGVGLTAQAFFARDAFAATWASTPAGALDAIAVRGTLMAGLPGVMTWVLLGALMWIFSGTPTKARVLVIVVCRLGAAGVGADRPRGIVQRLRAAKSDRFDGDPLHHRHLGNHRPSPDADGVTQPRRFAAPC